MRFLFSCGGTGGHINPAIAVARLVAEKRKDAEILFVGVDGGMETRLVPATGFEIKTIKANSISRKLTFKAIFKNLKTVGSLATAKRDAKEIISGFRPDVVMGTGGYACFPVISAAAEMKIPTVLHEANAHPGLATRRLAKKVTKILLNFEKTADNLPKRVPCKVVGYPVRGDILMYDRESARNELGITKPLLVTFWGSLGAREMNENIAEFMKLEKENGADFCHIHACGKFGYEWMPKLLSENGVTYNGEDGIWLREYIDDMPRVLAAADLVMCRGGAGTLSEINSRGVPAIIIPSPNVTDNHQYKNAMELLKVGGAEVIEEADVNVKSMYERVCSIINDKEKLSQMRKKLIESATLDSTEKIYEELISAAKK